MAEKKKGKQRKTEEDKPTKEEYAIAKYLRFNLSAREGKLHGMEVKCFFGNTAVDKLLESKWSATKNKKDPLFTNRNSCVAYMLRLLEMGLFHRAEREQRKRDKEKDKSKRKKKDKEGEKEDAQAEEELRERKVKKDKKGRKEKDGEAHADEETEKKELDKKGEKKDDKKKKEKRLKLVMPDEQFFEDGDEIYVWIYDPVNAKTFLIGLLMVLGAIALCMFPLWPEGVRIGVYYLSIALAGFVGFILSLVVVRLILFCFIWTLTLGKHHFWLLPNLTEDVGFFDSFRPLYKHDVVNKSSESKAEGGKKKKKLDKDEEDKQETVEVKEKSSDKDDSDEFELIKKEDLDQNGVKDENDFDKNEEDDEADVDNEGDDYIENDFDDNGENEVDDNDDNNDEELEEDDDDDEEEESSELNKGKREQKKKTK